MLVHGSLLASINDWVRCPAYFLDVYAATRLHL